MSRELNVICSGICTMIRILMIAIYSIPACVRVLYCSNVSLSISILLFFFSLNFIEFFALNFIRPEDIDDYRYGYSSGRCLIFTALNGMHY